LNEFNFASYKSDTNPTLDEAQINLISTTSWHTAFHPYLIWHVVNEIRKI